MRRHTACGHLSQARPTAACYTVAKPTLQQVMQDADGLECRKDCSCALGAAAAV